MAATYTFGQLEQLWQQAGGSARLAPTMAAIGLAESGGRVNAVHHDSNGSTDYGLWQINSVHGYNTAQLSSNPLYNARAAVAIEKGSGLGAWSTYKSGAYRRYMTTSNVSAGTGLPYNPNDSTVGRIDQGVDITSSSPFTALASGTVVHIDPNFYNGTPAVYIRLDQPVSVNGRTYKGVYYSETKALVKTGQHVTAGQNIIGPGSAEIGFAAKMGSSASSWLPAAHNSYTEGKPTQAGADFAATIKTNKGGGSSFWSSISGAATTAFNVSPAGLAVNESKAVISGAGSVASGVSSVTDFLGKLTSAAFWLRAAEVVGGGVLVLLGIYLLVRQVGLNYAVPLPAAAKDAANNAANSTSTPRPDTRTTTKTYYLEEPASTRRKRFAARSGDPASNEIPF